MISIDKLLKYYESGSLEVYEHVKSCIDRIHTYNNQINAFVTLNQDAIQEAHKKDYQIRNNPDPFQDAPLFGVTVAIKDTICTQGIATSVGQENIFEYREDAYVVKLLKEAGAIIIGKTNTPTFSLDVQTFNTVIGATGNPYDLNLTSGGSSGGSAVSVTLGMSDIAIGSDLNGSLRIPSSFVGCCSLKPTEGRVSIHGHIPPYNSADVLYPTLNIGPMARTVDDLAKATEIIMKNNTYYYDLHVPFNKEIYNNKNKKLNELKLLILPNITSIETDLRISDYIQNVFIPILESKGVSLEISHTLGYDMVEIVNTQRIFGKVVMNSINHESISKEYITIDEYLKAIESKNLIRRHIEKILISYDAIICPVTPVLPFQHNPLHEQLEINNRSINYWKAIVPYVTPFTVSGHPVTTIPIGLVDNKPLGIQIIGKRWRDEQLLKIAEIISGNISKLPTPTILSNVIMKDIEDYDFN
jgi:amidase